MKCNNILDKIKIDALEHLRKECLGVSPVDPIKMIEDLFSERRIDEQFDILMRFSGKLQGKRILEIGSGYGLFVARGRTCYGADAYGVEPASDNLYADAFDISQKVLEVHGIDINTIVNTYGERLPFKNESFDVVYSSNTLEHVKDPYAVLSEAIRVLRAGGIAQFVVPNYGSFYEGHYAIPWIPYIPHWLAKKYVSLFGKDPDFLDTLQFINYFTLASFLKHLAYNIEILGWGEDIFRQRMTTAHFSTWSGLELIQRWLAWARKLKLQVPLATLLISARAFSPIILTFKKKVV